VHGVVAGVNVQLARQHAPPSHCSPNAASTTPLPQRLQYVAGSAAFAASPRTTNVAFDASHTVLELENTPPTQHATALRVQLGVHVAFTPFAPSLSHCSYGVSV